MLGINVEQGRIRDTPGLSIKSCLRLLVDRFDLPMTLTPSQSIVLRDIEPKDKWDIEGILKEHGIKMVRLSASLWLPNDSPDDSNHITLVAPYRTPHGIRDGSPIINLE